MDDIKSRKTEQPKSSVLGRCFIVTGVLSGMGKAFLLLPGGAAVKEQKGGVSNVVSDQHSTGPILTRCLKLSTPG